MIKLTITSFQFARFANMQTLHTTEASELDQIPTGYNNSLRWNVGHVITMAENLLSLSEHYTPTLPSHYSALFNMGTSPKEWTEEPPTAEDLIQQSKKQLEAVEALIENHADKPLVKNFELYGFEFTTPADLLSFICFHEGIHQGTIKAIKKEITK